jgi:hypothetical protein
MYNFKQILRDTVQVTFFTCYYFTYINIVSLLISKVNYTVRYTVRRILCIMYTHYAVMMIQFSIKKTLI